MEKIKKTEISKREFQQQINELIEWVDDFEKIANTVEDIIKLTVFRHDIKRLQAKISKNNLK